MKRAHVLSLAIPFLVATASYVGCSGTGGSEPIGTGAGGGSAASGGTGGNDASASGGDGGTAGQATGGANTGGSGVGGANTGGNATGGGGSGTGGSVEHDAAPDVDFSYDAPAYEAPEACATQDVEAQLKPLDLYMMVDRSASMSGTPWVNQSNALKAFFNDPASAGITVAMRFFPLDNNCSPQNSSCNGNAYATPLVDWGVLNGHATALANAINATSPNGCFTPTEEALYGVLKGAQQRQIAQPGHVVVAVIVSDGQPCCDDCPIEDAAGIGNIAGSYYNGANANPPIRTFAIFVAPDANAVMTQIAQKGGTDHAYNATGGSQVFIDALKAIQGTAIPCDFDMPHPSQGVVDPNQVTLQYLPGGTGTPVDVPRVPDSGQCGSGDGWYYDNNTNPTKITLCPATCATMKADPKAKVNISLGCLGS
jgi:hypothetical protein